MVLNHLLETKKGLKIVKKKQTNKTKTKQKKLNNVKVSECEAV